MPSVITDPNAYARAIVARRKALQQAQGSLVPQAPVEDNGVMYDPMTGVPITQPNPDPAIVPPGVVSPQPQQTLDPAQAGAEGYRIPNYIPPAQTAGGSGTYMSKVPMDAPQPSRGGIGSDYVAGGAQSADVASTGSVAAQDQGNDFFSFFNKPQATDAMAAFGAGMLRGKNFSEGLANATEAVNNVSQKYRPYTPEELQRMTQKAEIERMARAKATGQQVEWSRPLYDNKGQLFYPATDASGNPGFYNSNTGKLEPTVAGGLRAEDSTKKYESKDAVKSAGEARGAAMEARKRMGQADDLLSMYESAGGGAGAVNEAIRKTSTFFDTDLLGVNVGDTQRIEGILSDMELTQAQTQRGLGQLTEAERQIIRNSLPKIGQSKEAFYAMVTAIKRQSERARLIYRNWSASKELQSKYPNIEDYYLQWMDGEEGKSFDAETQRMTSAAAPKSGASGSGSSSPNGGVTSSGIKFNIEQ